MNEKSALLVDTQYRRWLGIYRANPMLKELGIRMDMFLAEPLEIFLAAVYNRPPLVPPARSEFLPLLPRQAAVAEQTEEKQ